MSKNLFRLFVFVVSISVVAHPVFSMNEHLSSVSVDPDTYTGSATMGMSINVPAGRGGIQPNIQLQYNSRMSNDIAGVGWLLELGSIQRSVKKGWLQYDNTDDFTLRQSGSSQELIDISGNQTEFRAKVEGAFMKIERIGVVGNDYWLVTDKNGTQYYFGQTTQSMEYHPTVNTEIFKWCLDKVVDLHGNTMTIDYIREEADNRIYPGTIHYTSNASLPAFATVEFNYEPRTDTPRDHMAGWKRITSKRLNTIDIKVEGSLQRQYDLEYTESLRTKRSLLTSVTQYGSDGTTSLPPVTFTYQDDVEPTYSAPQYHSVGNLTTDDEFFTGDFNGDGRVDLAIFNSTTATIDVQLANGNGFDAPVRWISNFAGNADVHTGDFDGDGRTDFVSHVFEIAGDWTVALSDGTQFVDTGYLWLASFGNNAKIAVGDYTGDGKTDIAKFSDQSGTWQAEIAVNTGSFFDRWSHIRYTAGDSQQGEAGVLSSDFNGDGLVDLATFYIGTADWYISLNSGDPDADFQPEVNVTNVNNNTPSNHSRHHLVDADLDRHLDLVYHDYANGQIQVKLSNTLGFFQPGGGQIMTIPVTFTITSLTSRPIIGDFNGDGLPDYMVREYDENSGSFGSFEIAFSNGQYSDLLSSVDNGVGGITTMTYDSSVNNTSNQFLPFAVQVVKTNTVSDSRGSTYTTTYDYSGGFWDAQERAFCGFGFVTVTDPENHYQEIDYDTQPILKSRVKEQRQFDAAGNLFSKTVNTWDTQPLDPGVTFVLLKRKDNFVFDGDATARRTAEEFFYEEPTQLGNLTKAIQYGEVDLTTGNDIGTDTRSVETSYVNNTSAGNWLVGLPNVTTIKDNSGSEVRKTWFYYDNNDNTTPPAVGLLTKKEDWAGQPIGDPANPVTSYTYDTTGNLLTTTDPLSNVTTIAYDTTYNIFPISTTNAMTHAVTNEYYGVNETIESGFTGLWGQLKSTTDPNQQIGKRVYNVFGDLTATVSPLDSLSFPTQSTEIVYLSDHVRTTTRQRINHGAPETIDSVTFTDGLGRSIQTKGISGVAGQFIVSGQVEYNSRGLPEKQYLNYFTSNGLTVIDAIDPGKPHTSVSYDAAGRTLQTTNPDGSFSSAIYDDWTTTAINENGHKQESAFDAYGRLIEKREFTGADGRSAPYPLTPYTLYATTKYTYDSEGNLVQTEDAHNNLTTITYDTLGRKIAMDDPDMGVWSYDYDLNGNLVKQTDAKNQMIDFTYDALNRLTNKTDSGSLNVNYTYDDNLVTHSKGRLTKSAYAGSEQTEFAYDEIGREIQSIKNINNTNYSVERNYDALNNLLDVQYPDQENIFYKYNPAGQIEAISNDPTLFEQQSFNWQVSDEKGINLASRTSSVVYRPSNEFDRALRVPAKDLTRSTKDDIRSTNFLDKIGSMVTHFYTEWFEPNILGIKPAYADQSLITHLNFDEGSGNVAIDVTGNGHDGVISGATYATGHLGSALDFDGSSNNYVLDDDGEQYINGLGAFTVSLWIKSDITGTDRGFILGKEPNGGDNQLSFRYDADGYEGGGTNLIKFAFGTTNGSQVYESASNIQTTNWQHLAVTWTAGSQTSLYIDGVKDVPTYISGTPSGTVKDLTKLYIAKGTKSASKTWKGLIDDVRIYDRALSQQEILDLFNGSGDPTPTATIDASPNPIDEGGQTTLTWSSTDADTCTASNGWSDPIGTSGNMIKSPTVTTTYSIQCSGAGGTSSLESVTVTVNPPPPPPPLVAPVLNPAIAGDTEVDLSWNAVAGATGYKIKYGTISGGGSGNGTDFTQDIDCVAAWKLDEVSGSVIDSCGVSNGTTSGNLSRGVAGQYDNAIEFFGPTSGNNAIVNLGSDVSVDNLAARTLTAWIYPHTLGHNDLGTIINKDVQNGWVFRVSANNNIAFSQAFSGGIETWKTTTNALQLNTWQHVAVTYAGTGTGDVPILYINGVAQAITNPAPFGSIDDDASEPLQMGIKDGTQEFDGLLDEVAIFKRILSVAEINEIKDNRLDGGLGSGSSYEFTVDAGDVTNYTVTGLTNNTTYYFVVSAYNAIEEGPDSNEESAVPASGVGNAQLFVEDVQYNAHGQVTQMTYGNGVVTTNTYDPLTLRLTRIHTVDALSAVVQDLNYTYDSVGNILSITDNVNTADQTFQYDEMNRLTHAVGETYGTKNYAYNEIGNIISKDALLYTYGEGGAGPHVLTSRTDGTTFTYDANGNMQTKQEPDLTLNEYFYDTENRLIEVKRGGLTIGQYEYDGDGGRTLKDTGGVTTEYIGSLYEEDNQGRKSSYIFLGDQRIASITNGVTRYYHADHLGGTNVLTSDTGELKELIEYNPFGTFARHEKYGTDDEIAMFYFTGKQVDDETGLYYYGARYYDPDIGRFITADTIVQAPDNPQTLNRYSYTANNPVNAIDPSGHFFKKLFKAIFKVLLPFVPEKHKGKVIGGLLTLAGLPYLGAAVSSAYNTVINNGHFGDFARGFGIGIISAGIGGAIGDTVGNFAGGFVAAGVSGAVAGGISSIAFGGNFGDGAQQGAIFAAAGYLAVKGAQAVANKLEGSLENPQEPQKTNSENIQEVNGLKGNPAGVAEAAEIVSNEAENTNTHVFEHTYEPSLGEKIMPPDRGVRTMAKVLKVTGQKALGKVTGMVGNVLRIGGPGQMAGGIAGGTIGFELGLKTVPVIGPIYGGAVAVVTGTIGGVIGASIGGRFDNPHEGLVY